MWNDDDEDEQQPYKKSPGEVAPTVLLWLFFANTFRVLVPAIGCMLVGIWVGKRMHHVQAAAIIGTLIGFIIAGLLIWQQANSTKAKRS